MPWSGRFTVGGCSHSRGGTGRRHGRRAAIARNMATDQAEQVAKGSRARVLHAGKETGRSAIEEALTEPIQGVIEQVGTTAAAPAQVRWSLRTSASSSTSGPMEATSADDKAASGRGGSAPGALPVRTQPGRPAQVAPGAQTNAPAGTGSVCGGGTGGRITVGRSSRVRARSAKLTDEEVARLGLVRQEAPAAKPGDQPSEQPAGRQASTLAELLG